MSERSFYEDQAKAAAKATVEAIENQTSAEVVIALRKSSGSYRAADYLFGAALALATLVTILVLPSSFRMIAVPVDLVVAFALGVFLCSRSPALRRMLTGPNRRREQLQVAAKAAFVDLGISRTTGRWGVLIYLSMLERDAEVVADVGLDFGAMGEDWPKAVSAIREAVARTDFEGFKAAALALGPVLGKAHPRRDDDVNELPDEVSA
ncbi:MAG TPA: hypothetical protein VGK67_37495 [Myxococcales bacterium]|jgi:putative membrane protein